MRVAVAAIGVLSTTATILTVLIEGLLLLVAYGLSLEEFDSGAK